MTVEPLLFLGFSVLLVAVSVTALVVAAFPAIQDVSRAARSAEKLFDRLDRELSPTLKAIELAAIELGDLGDEMSQGVQSASAVVQQVDISITEVKKQAGNVKVNTQSFWVGIKAAWQTWRDGSDSVLDQNDRLNSRQRNRYLEDRDSYLAESEFYSSLEDEDHRSSIIRPHE